MVNIPPGMRVPLHCGASAKVLLAFGPPAVANEYLAREHLARLTPQTHSSVPPLREELASIRVQGYAFSRGEVDADLWAVGAPILDAHGNLTAALSVVAPLSRGSHEQVDKARRAILATSMAFSRRLGFGSDPTATEEVIGERG
jgi:DNA-binding IclR family transcriptional regulator